MNRNFCTRCQPIACLLTGMIVLCLAQPTLAQRGGAAQDTHGMLAVQESIPSVPDTLRLVADSQSSTASRQPASAVSSVDDANSDSKPQSALSNGNQESATMFDTGALQAQVRKLVIGTLTVLVLCVGFMFVSKRWLQGGLPLKQKQQHLQHLASLQLPNRCTVQLVDADGCRVLVGTDASGVKMIVPLQPSFWEHLDETPPAAPHATDDASQEPSAASDKAGFDLASVTASFQQLLSSREAAA